MIIDSDDQRTIYYAYEHDSYLGSCKVVPCVEGLEICRVWVNEEYRGRGVAQALLNKVKEDYGDKHLVGYTNNPAMGQIFNKCGFRRTAIYDYYESGPSD